MKALLAVMIIAAMAMAAVDYTSMYQSDMEVLDYMLQENDIYGVIRTTMLDGDVVIGVTLNESFNDNFEDNYKVGIILGSVGLFTSETNWHSDQCFVIFADNQYGFIASTAACRALDPNMTDRQFARWVQRNLSGGYF